MKLLLSFLISMGITLLFSACGGSTPKPIIKQVHKSTPSWYLNPKTEDTKYLYAVGMGEDKKEATLVALNEVSSKFGVVVESSFNTQKITDSALSLYEKKTSSNMKIQVQATKITNYEVTKVYKQNFEQYIVELKVEKLKYSAGLLKGIDAIITSNTKIIAAMKNRNYLKKLQTYEMIYSQNKEISRNLAIVKYLRKDFNDSFYVKYLNDIEKDYLYYKNNLKVYVKYDKASRIFQSYFTSYLAKNNFQVVQKKTKNILEVQLNTNAIQERTLGFNLLVYTIAVDSYLNNEQLGSNTIIIKEVNKLNRTLTDKNAAVSFSQEVKDTAVNKTLGITQ